MISARHSNLKSPGELTAKRCPRNDRSFKFAALKHVPARLNRFSSPLILACAGMSGTCFRLSPRAQFLSLLLAGDRCNLLSMAISINRDYLIGALVSLVAGASAI